MTTSFFVSKFVEMLLGLLIDILRQYVIIILLLDKVVRSKKYLVVNSCNVVNFRSIVVEVMQ